MQDDKLKEQYFQDLFERERVEVPLSLQTKLDVIPDQHRILDWGKLVPLIIGTPAMILFLLLNGKTVLGLLNRSASIFGQMFEPSSLLFGFPLAPGLIMALLVTGGLILYFRNGYSQIPR